MTDKDGTIPTSPKAIFITPALAEHWLTKNTNNRKIARGHVARLAANMRAGLWQYNGEAICFDRDGNLVDGQHRLMAIVQSKQTIQSLVVGGLDPAVIETKDMDQRSRTAGDNLARAGFVNANKLAAAARLVLAYEKYGAPKMFYGSSAPSATEILHWLGNETNEQECHAGVNVGARVSHRIGVAISLNAALFVLFARQDEQQATVFFDQVAEGKSLAEGMPTLSLRERLISDRAHRREKNHIETAALYIKAWLAHREGRTLSRLQMRFNPETQEFPQWE